MSLGNERKYLLEAFDSNWIAPLGPFVDRFENDFSRAVEMPYAAALSSGTAALHLALRLIGIEAGDEVFCSDLTFIASAAPIVQLGCKPVFIDSTYDNWNMDPTILAQALKDAAKNNRLPKAVIVVDLYGQCADWDPIIQICNEYGVSVIEDAAEALGATYKGKPAGSFGRCSIFSFNGNKIITTSGGGMLVSNNKELIDRARFLSTQARDPAPHYEHTTIGYNYRLSNLLAAVGVGQIEVLSERIKARRANYSFYERHLGNIDGIQFMPEASYGLSTRWLTCLTINKKKLGVSREDLRLALNAENIESRPVWKPMHMQPVFRGCKSFGGGVAADLFENGLCLPSGSNLSEANLHRVVQAIKAKLGLC